MGIIYLAINYRSEGWCLKEYESLDMLIKDVQDGQTLGSPWKVLEELNVKIEKFPDAPIITKEEKDG